MKIGRNHLYWVSGLIIAVGLFFYFRSKGIHYKEISDSISHFRADRLLIAGAFVLLMQLPLQGSRLWVLVPLPRLVGWWTAMRAFIFGQAINAFAPARAGDALKVVILNRESAKQLSVPVATGILLSDKLVDVSSVFLLCGIACYSWIRDIHSLPLPALRGLGIAAGVLAAAVAVIYFFFPTLRNKLLNHYRAFSRGLAEGLAPLKNFRQSIPALLVSMAGWYGELLAIQALCVGQGYPLTLGQVMWAMLVLNIGIAIPMAVANVGVFEASMAFGLGQVGVPLVAALAISTVHHAFQVVGVYFWAGVLALARLVSDNRATVRKRETIH